MQTAARRTLAEAQNDADILATVYATLDAYHHPTSTCRMGGAGDPCAVVGLGGRVLGLAGLP